MLSFGPIALIQKIIGGAMLGLIAFLSIALFMADRRGDKFEGQSRRLAAELERISTKRDEQKRETARTIKVADKGNREAARVAERIEWAPLPGLCQTPREVLGGDL